MKQYFSWFFQLSEREQKLVSIGAIAALVAVFYFAIWSPMQDNLSKQQTALASDQALLTWIEEQASKARQLRGSASSQTYKGSLTQLINSSARRNNVEVSRIQPQGENLQISIDRVSFQDLVTWIEFLERQGVALLYSDITETDTSGYVQVRRLQIGKA